MTIYWTSEDCHGQAILTLHLSVGQVIIFPYFDHCATIGLAGCPYFGIYRSIMLSLSRIVFGFGSTSCHHGVELLLLIRLFASLKGHCSYGHSGYAMSPYRAKGCSCLSNSSISPLERRSVQSCLLPSMGPYMGN